MAASRAQSESGSVVNTKFGARPIIDLPGFAFAYRANQNSNFADVPPRMFGPTEYSYNVGKNVPRDNANGGYVGQYYNYPNQMSPRGYQNQNSNLIQESNVIPYPSYNTMPNMAAQQYNNLPNVQQTTMPQNQGQLVPEPVIQHGGQEKEIHLYYGPNGEKLPGPPPPNMFQRPNSNFKSFPRNFKIEAILEHGKMVSVRIREGNVSFRDIPDFVLTDCQKTYRVIPKTEVTIVAENGIYSVYATPDLLKPMFRQTGYMYDPRERKERRIGAYPGSTNRKRGENDIFTKKYDDEEYFIDDSYGRRQYTHEYYRDHREIPRKHGYSGGVRTQEQYREPREVPRRHWYSSGDNRPKEYDGLRDPQRKPLPMKPMNLRKTEKIT